MSIAMIHKYAKKHLHRSWPFVVVMVIAFSLVSLIGAKVGYASKPVTSTSSLVSSEEVRVLLANVRRHILFNSNEQPTVATVNDADALRALNSSFYKNAQNGDRVIVWKDKAVLYSGARDLVVAIASFDLASRSSDGASQAPAPVVRPEPESAVIKVENGTRTKGLASVMAKSLTSAGLTVARIGDASTHDNRTTRIISVSNKSLPKTLETLQRITGASVVPATAGQWNVDADFIVIVGADYSPPRL